MNSPILLVFDSITARCVGSNTNEYNYYGEPIPILNCTGSPPVLFNNTAVQYDEYLGMWFIVNEDGTIVKTALDESAAWEVGQRK